MPTLLSFTGIKGSISRLIVLYMDNFIDIPFKTVALKADKK